MVLNNILSFKLSVIDGMGCGQEADNMDTLPEEAIKAVLVKDGVLITSLRFLLPSGTLICDCHFKKGLILFRCQKFLVS